MHDEMNMDYITNRLSSGIIAIIDLDSGEVGHAGIRWWKFAWCPKFLKEIWC